MSGSNQPIKAVFFDLGFTLLYFAGDFYKVVLDSSRAGRRTDC